MYETQIASTNNIIVKNCGLVMMERKFQSVNKLQMLQQMMIAMVWKVSGKQEADFHIDLIEQKWIWTGKKEKSKEWKERKKNLSDAWTQNSIAINTSQTGYHGLQKRKHLAISDLLWCSPVNNLLASHDKQYFVPEQWQWMITGMTGGCGGIDWSL